MVLPDIVFIDTSVFLAENFLAPGNRINAIGKLAKEGKIRLVMPEIVRREVYKHIKSSVRQSWKAFNRDSRIFRNNVEIDKWHKTTNEKKEIENLTALFDKFLSDTKTRILDYGYCSDTGKVFDEYFSVRKPFGEGHKKDEFPDAFSLVALEKYSNEVKQHVVVLSCDGDMEGYESKVLDFEDYGEYVSRKVAEGVALDEVVRLLRDDKKSLESRIREAATDYLDDFRLYLTSLNLTEVSYHSVEEVDVDFNENTYELISVNDHYIEIEVQPEIAFKVDVEYVNYDYAVYDNEDGKWYGTEDETYEVDSSATVNVTMRYYFGQPQLPDYLDIVDIELSALSDAIE